MTSPSHPLGPKTSQQTRNQQTIHSLTPSIKKGETSALYNSGRLPARAYQGSTMYTTLSPCDMCTGACLLYGISRVVIGENANFLGGEAYLRSRGVEVVVVGDARCQELMDKFIAEKPELWCVHLDLFYSLCLDHPVT